MLVGVLLAATIAPQPSPSPLKTIIHLRATPFCTVLRENVGRAVGAMIQNNATVDQAKSLFLKLAHDKVSSANPGLVLDVDVNRLGPMIDAIARNLEYSQSLLSNSQAFPVQPKTGDERMLSEMQKELRGVVDHQNQELNVLSGTFYSYNGNRLLGHGPGFGLQAPEPPPPIVLPPIKPVKNGPTPQVTTTPLPGAAPAARPGVVDIGLAGLTKFAGLFNMLTTYQLDEQLVEAQAAKTIMRASAECSVSEN